MEDKKPKLTDPEEFAIIKKIYFKGNLRAYEDLDPIERLERLEAKERNKHKTSR